MVPTTGVAAMPRPSPAMPSGTAGTVTLRDGRILGFDDVGDPAGLPVIYLHGFGSSRLIRHPDDSIAARMGIRLLAVDRPGIGASTRRPGRRLLDWPADMAEFADVLGLARFGVLGWSGGGPYALASAWALRERITVCGVISGPAPLAGVREADYLYRFHKAAATAAGTAPWMIRLAMWRWARAQRRDPERHLDEAVEQMIQADRIVVDDPRVRALMLANVAELYRQGALGVYDEALIMARRWGFPLQEIRIPMRLWHGDDDPTVPVGMGRFIARRVPGCLATFFPGEGHHILFDRWEGMLTDLVR